MTNTIDFITFAKNYEGFNQSIYETWHRIFEDNDELNIIVNGYFLTFFPMKYRNLLKIKKLFKKMKIQYTKKESEIFITKRIAKRIALYYGSDELRSFLEDLPNIINLYDKYLSDIKIHQLRLQYN